MKDIADIETLVDGEIAKGTFPGIVLLVEKANILRYSLVKGFRQTFPTQEIMTEDTIFDLGSITKPLATAVLVLQLCEQEGIDLERKIGDFIPEIAPASGEITLLQLLLHTGGLPPDPLLYKELPDDQSVDRDRAVAKLLAIVPDKPPGTEVIYSCTGYLLLGQFLERTTNGSLDKLFREMIADTGRVGDLFFHPPAEARPRIAATEFCSWRKRWIRGEVHDENCFCVGGAGGNAGLFGTARSVLRLVSIFTTEGCLEGVRILSPAGVRRMSNCLTQGMNSRRSIGFHMQDDNSPVGANFSRSSFGHTGFPGTSIWIEPEKQLKIITLTNRVHLGREATDLKIKEFRRNIHSAIRRIWG
jgi:CubicO group peptidase (beta-lactamase class C family)